MINTLNDLSFLNSSDLKEFSYQFVLEKKKP